MSSNNSKKHIPDEKLNNGWKIKSVTDMRINPFISYEKNHLGWLFNWKKKSNKMRFKF